MQSLHPILSKETNESAILAMTDALMVHQGVLLNKDAALDDKVSKLVLSGLTDKRPKVKSGWAVASSCIIWGVNNGDEISSAVISFSKAITKNTFMAFNEVASNAVQASQTGSLISGYAIAAATLGRWLQWKDPQLGSPYF